MRIFGAPVVALFLASAAVAADSQMRVDLNAIAANGSKWVGQRVFLRACLINASPHGFFTKPCGTYEQWHPILPLDGPIKILPKELFVCPGGPDCLVEADMTGTLVKRWVDRDTGFRLMLRVETVTNVQMHTPARAPVAKAPR